MGGRLVKDKQGLTVRIEGLEDRDSFLDLNKELLGVPPCITVRSRINNLACIFFDIASFITNNKAAMLLIYKVRYMDESSSPFFA